MSDFELYFSLGRQHILDIHAYDHLLFVIALCTIYAVSDWQKVLVLITAFTIGHSLTLALVVFEVFSVNSSWVEFLIPLTILITALVNIKNRNIDSSGEKMSINYFFALFFGLIHGLGFSNYLKALLGNASSIGSELFAFNLGLEFGQIVIVGAFFAITFVINKYYKISKRDWVLAISSAVAGISVTLMIETNIWQ